MEKQERVYQKGITLVALVITIIILLILAGISIAALTGSGLFENAKLAKEKSDLAQEKEEQTLKDYEGEIGQYVDGSRDTNSIKMHSPITLVKASLPSTDNAIRNAGTYMASSLEYTKDKGESFDKYLQFEENVGWKVLQEGFYLINATSYHYYTSANIYSYDFMWINDVKVTLARGIAGSAFKNGAYDTGNMTVYLNKDDIIDFEYNVTGPGSWSYATFYIYAMFE